MNQYKSSSELKNLAKEKLTGKYGSAMLVSPLLQYAFAFVMVFPLIMILLVPYVINVIMKSSEVNEPVLFLIIYALIFPCSILLGVLNSGIALFYLNIACGKHHSVSDIFFGFRWQFKKSLGLSAVTTGLSTLFMLPYYIFSYLEIYFYEPKWSVLTVVSYIVGVIIYLPIQLSLSQCFYLLLDFPQHNTRELLQLSARVMKGHKKRLFYIQLSFLPLEILSACTFNIGNLWLVPYMNMTYSLFFLDIMNPKKTVEPQYDQYI